MSSIFYNKENESMSKHKNNSLIFIDTNIFLDFYRSRDYKYEKSMSKHIDDNHDKIITTDQVFMEYKKNRQSVIIESLRNIGKHDINIKAPAFLSDSGPIKAINSYKKTINDQLKKLEKRMIDVLQNPTQKDVLYQCLQRLFKDDCPFHLGRTNKLRFKIRNLARKRFCLGYPPRKNNDTSIGDAINWEWIVHCAEISGKDIVIVSRDNDYGLTYEKTCIINDWLSHEFKDRISQQRKIVLTDRLSEAFKKADVKITKNEEKEEDKTLQDIKLIYTESSMDDDLFSKFLEFAHGKYN